MDRAGDVGLVPFGLLAHVEELNRAFLEQPLQLVELDRPQTFRCLHLGHVAGELQEADGTQTSRRLVRLVVVGGVDNDAFRGIEDEPGPRRERVSGDRHVEGAVDMARSMRLHRAHVEDGCVPGRVEPVQRRRRSDERPTVERDDAGGVGRARRGDGCRCLDVPECERGIGSLLVTDGRRVRRAHGCSAKRARDVSRIDLVGVRKLRQALKGVEESLRSRSRLDREVGSSGVADEQRVPGQHEAFVDDEGAMLGSVAGCVDHAHARGTRLEHLTVLERGEVEFRLGKRVDRHRSAVLEREAAVAGHVIGMRVGLEHSHDADAAVVRRFQVLLDRVRGVDHERLAAGGVAEQVGGAAEIVVDELAEQHEREANTARR